VYITTEVAAVGKLTRPKKSQLTTFNCMFAASVHVLK